LNRPIVLYLGLYLLAVTLPRPATTAPETSESYWVRGEEIVLDLDPAALAFEIPPAASLDKAVALPPGGVETLYRDPDSGRYVLRFENEEAAKRIRKSKSESVRIFPVYTSRSGPAPVWAYDLVSIRIRQAQDESAFREFLAQNNLTVYFHSPFNSTRFVVEPLSPTPNTAFDWARAFLGQPFTLWAEPVLYGGYRLHAPPPNDPFFPNQVYHNLIRTLDGWDLTYGSPNVVVAVLDEGIDPIHPDLTANLWQNPGESPTPDGIDDDGNGFIDDIHGWDFTDNNGDVTPLAGPGLTGHGTAVAGIVAAVHNNALGVAGVAPGVKVLSLRLFNGGDSGAVGLHGGTALEYAATYADVANLSWGGMDPTNVVLDGIDFALTNGRGGKGTVVVASAGNDDGRSVLFPARYPWAVAVAESDLADQKHDESSFDRTLSLIAPEALWSTDSTGDGNGFDPASDYVSAFGGTSSAAPQVSAVVALILSRNPGLTAGEAVCHLTNGADHPFPGMMENDLYGKSATMGYGRVNAYRASSFGSSYADDRLEPNDTAADAAPVTTGFYPWLYLHGNPDYYKVEAAAGGPIVCSIESLGTLGELEVALLDSAQQTVAVSSNTGNPFSAGMTRLHTLSFVPPAAGTYYLLVRPLTGPGQPYRMDVQVAAPDDAYEPNNSVVEAATLTPGAGATYKNLVANDDDYYRVNLTVGQYLYGMATFDHSLGDLGIQAIAPDGFTVVAQDDRSSYGEFFAGVQASQSGDYYVRIYRPQNQYQREYSLHLAVLNQPPIPAGSDDGFEDDDTVATSVTLMEGYYPNLAIGLGGGEEDDNFRFTLPAGKRGRMTIGQSNFSTDLDIRVFPDLVFSTTPSLVAPVAKSSRLDVPVESVEIPAAPTDHEFLIQIRRTFARPASHTHYSFALEFLDPKPTPWVAFWRLQEGRDGELCDPDTIRDWRGPLFSGSPSGYGSLEWTSAPHLPGSDGVALDCSSGGVYFPGNGSYGELELGNVPFTLWIRFKPEGSGASRFLAGIPGVWEFAIDAADRLTFTARSGAPSQTYLGPPIVPSAWQDAAVVWNPNTPSTGVRILGTGENGLVETVLPITLAFNGTGTFHLGSSTGGASPLGLVEQVRYYKEAVSTVELQGFSTTITPSAQSNWELYR
jgi:subtilisin family serine protease